MSIERNELTRLLNAARIRELADQLARDLAASYRHYALTKAVQWADKTYRGQQS